MNEKRSRAERLVALSKPTGMGPQSLADAVRKASKSEVFGAPYGHTTVTGRYTHGKSNIEEVDPYTIFNPEQNALAYPNGRQQWSPPSGVRCARITRDLPSHFKGKGVDPDSWIMKGSRVYCRRAGKRTWICTPRSRPTGIEFFICNTRDLVFVSSISNIEYRKVQSFEPAESHHWATHARKNAQVRWARRILGKALRFEKVWTEKCQSAVNDVVMDVLGSSVTADLLRAMSAAPFGAARRAKVLEAIEPKYMDLWEPKIPGGPLRQISATRQQKTIDALVILVGVPHE